MLKEEKAAEILFLAPVFKQMLWGGSQLRDKFGYEIPGDDTGECWAVSAHPNGDCTVKEGKYQGETLSGLWEKHPELFGGPGTDRFPLLVKIIDAKDDLSIQVHPNDGYAKIHENGSLGKTECWYILDCPEDASLVIGHNAGSKEELEEMVHQGKWEELIRQVPVKKGDFIQIDPGTVHAIKADTLILETQQNSAITYRLYDYGRLQNGKPRQLHIDKSLDVITVPAKSAEDSVKSISSLPENQLNQIYTCEKYTVFKLDVDGTATFRQGYPFLAASVLEGEGRVNGDEVRKGDHFILPCGYGEVEAQGNMSLILSTVEK